MYKRGEITVGEFNSRAFALVKKDETTLVNFTRQNSRVRPGFPELIAFCKTNDIEFLITSNGLDFYIKTVLGDLGLNGIRIYAAKTDFDPGGVKVKYLGPGGSELMGHFKETYTNLFLSKGYRVIYIGNGISDAPAADLCHHIFAREDLLTHCQATNCAKFTPFSTMNEVVKGLENLDNHH